MRLLKFNLYQKILLSVGIVIVAFDVFFTALIYQTAKNDMQLRDKEAFLKFTFDLVRITERSFSHGRTVSQTLASHTEVRKFMSQSKGTKIRNSTQVQALMENHNLGKLFSAIYLVDTSGYVVASTDQSFLDHNSGLSNYFKSAINGDFGVDAGMCVVKKKIGYYFSYPIYSLDGATITGVAVVKMDPAVIHDDLRSTDFGLDSSIMFTNDNGVILFSEKPERILWSLTKLTQEQIEEERTARFINRKIEPLTYEFVWKEIDNFVRPTMVEAYDEKDKMDEVVSVAKVGEYPFYLVVEASKSSLLKHISDQMPPILIYVSLNIILSLVLIGILLHFFLKPKKVIRVSRRSR